MTTLSEGKLLPVKMMPSREYPPSSDPLSLASPRIQSHATHMLIAKLLKTDFKKHPKLDRGVSF